LSGIGGDLARALEVPAANIHAHQDHMGGGFGSKFASDRWGMICAKLSKKAAGRAVLASRPSEIDFVAEGGVRGVVQRCAYLGEIIDYRIDVGGQEVRVQKNRRAPGPREGETCGLVFLKPHWYAGEGKSS
jgi:CO/xanthine dehydrogenase Mo-binding subunit